MSFGILRRLLNPAASNSKSTVLRRFLNTAASDSKSIHNGNGKVEGGGQASETEIPFSRARFTFLMFAAVSCAYLIHEKITVKATVEDRRRQLQELIPMVKDWRRQMDEFLVYQQQAELTEQMMKKVKDISKKVE